MVVNLSTHYHIFRVSPLTWLDVMISPRPIDTSHDTISTAPLAITPIVSFLIRV